MGDLGLSHKNKKFRQGVFIPKNKDKFIGEKAIYRSGLELDYFKKLDANPNVVKWGSEEVKIPYLFEDKWHNYYVDVFVVFKVGEKLKKFLIELKPYAQTIEPVWSAKRKQENYIAECKMLAKNRTKWHYATEFAKKNGCEFHILTEKDLER